VRVVPISAIGTMLSTSVSFGVFDTISGPRNMRVMGKIALAQSTLLVASAISYPFLLISNRLIVANSFHGAKVNGWTSVKQCVSSVVEKHGFKGLWRGFPATIFLSVSSAVAMVTYDYAKAKF